MKKLTQNEWIGVAASLALVGFFLFGGVITSLFNLTPKEEEVMNIPTSGYLSEDRAIGTGEIAQPGDIVTVHYVGTLESGKVFDSSVDRNEPFTFPLGEGRVIKGWDEGVVGMQVGGVRKLIIAPDYAYGDRAIGPIPANSPLFFEIQLLDVIKGGQ